MGKNTQTIIESAISCSDNPFNAYNRNELSSALGIVRNSTYLLQRQGKLPPPISPPIGSKFWYRYEIDALLIAMSNPDIYQEEMVSELIKARKNLPQLIDAITSSEKEVAA